MGALFWKQRKIGELLLVNSGKDYKKLNKGNIPVYGTGGYMLSVDKALSFYDAIGIGRKGTIDRPQYLRAPFWTVDTLFFMTSKKKNDLKFLYALSQNINWKKYDESTGLPSLAKKTISSILVKVPQDKEQKLIGRVISQIDYVQNLQQRKLEQLKLVKKALLQDLFTSKEASILRFKGFSGKWEKHKLGDFGTVAMNKRIFKNQTTETGDIPFYKIGTFGKKADSFISRKLFEQYKKRYPYPQKGDLLISASGSIGRIIEYKGEAAYYQDSNIVWLNHNNKLLNSFLKAYYQIIHWDGIEGSTIKRLYNKNILLTKIYLPTLKEQQEIGVLFKVIDEEIDLQQKRIYKLQTIKQFLLQNMFI